LENWNEKNIVFLQANKPAANLQGKTSNTAQVSVFMSQPSMGS